MIKKMIKYSILAFTPEVASFLEKLQEQGLVDVTRDDKPFDEISREEIELAKRYKDITSKIKGFAKPDAQKSSEDPHTALYSAEHLLSNLALLKERYSSIEKSAKEAEVWGQFHSDDIERLKNIGIIPHFYCINNKKYDKTLESIYPIQVIETDNKNTYFVALERVGEEFEFPAQEISAPIKSVNEFLADAALIQSEIDETNAKLASYAAIIPQFEKEYNKLLDHFDVYSAAETSTKEAENTITVITGFSFVENEQKVKKFLDECNMVYISEDAKVEDNPPVKLKNNWFAKVFEAIGDLYVLPQYDELDLTPYFAPFYMLFFGLCLGDMGYGLLLLIAGIVAVAKIPALKDYGKLVIWLGLGTVIMPMLNGSFFGLNIYELLNINFGPNSFLPFSNMKMFWFAIIFGLVHVIFARIISAIYLMRKKGWQEGLSNIGWSMFLVWVALIYAGSQNGTKMVTPVMTYILCYGGLGLILLFSKPVKNIGKRLFGGVAALYDITGFFGDVLSYIRLFGLGCSGGCLAIVMNALASQAGNIPYVGWLFCGIILLVGHGLVFGLSALGAFVHPMRLTFVEFYKNAGFNGGGRPYKPLTKKNK